MLFFKIQIWLSLIKRSLANCRFLFLNASHLDGETGRLAPADPHSPPTLVEVWREVCIFSWISFLNDKIKHLQSSPTTTSNCAETVCYRLRFLCASPLAYCNSSYKVTNQAASRSQTIDCLGKSSRVWHFTERKTIDSRATQWLSSLIFKTSLIALFPFGSLGELGSRTTEPFANASITEGSARHPASAGQAGLKAP